MALSSQQTRKEAESKVRSWGFNHVFTWTDGPNAYYRPHTHPGATTHLILAGQLTIRYPDERDASAAPAARVVAAVGADDDDNDDGRDATNTTTSSADDGGGDDGKRTFGVGDRVDVAAGRRHEVWMGDEGCTYVIGE